MTDKILGIHHVTAIAGDPQRNLDFYTGVLGLRLVKVTVNFDDPGTYHFYFGDGSGQPGTILTFFPWPGARRGRRGNGQVAVTAFSIPEGATGYWQERLKDHGVFSNAPLERLDETVLVFADPDGLHLELTDQAKEFLIDKGYNPEFGARPLRRAIEQYIEDPLSEGMLRGEFKGKNLIKVDVQDEEHLKLEGSEMKEPEESDKKAHAVAQSQDN